MSIGFYLFLGSLLVMICGFLFCIAGSTRGKRRFMRIEPVINERLDEIEEFHVREGGWIFVSVLVFFCTIPAVIVQAAQEFFGVSASFLVNVVLALQAPVILGLVVSHHRKRRVIRDGMLYFGTSQSGRVHSISLRCRALEEGKVRFLHSITGEEQLSVFAETDAGYVDLGAICLGFSGRFLDGTAIVPDTSVEPMRKRPGYGRSGAVQTNPDDRHR